MSVFVAKSCIFMPFCIIEQMQCWLVDLILNVPVNNFSVMLERSHRFLGITSTFER